MILTSFRVPNILINFILEGHYNAYHLSLERKEKMKNSLILKRNKRVSLLNSFDMIAQRVVEISLSSV